MFYHPFSSLNVPQIRLYFHFRGILYILSPETVGFSSFLLFWLSYSFPCKVAKEVMSMVWRKGGAVGATGNNSSSLKAVIYFSLIVKLLQIAQKLFKDPSD